MSDRPWGAMLLANAAVALLLAWVVLATHIDTDSSIADVVDLARESDLLRFGIIVLSNAFVMASLGTMLLAAVPVRGMASAISLFYALAFFMEAIVGGFPLLFVLAAFSALSAWRLRRKVHGTTAP